MPEVATESVRAEQVDVRGEDLLSKVKEVIHSGNVRRISVMNDEGDTVMEFPLTAGVVGAIFAPALVALGAIAALAKNYKLIIERSDEASV